MQCVVDSFFGGQHHHALKSSSALREVAIECINICSNVHKISNKTDVSRSDSSLDTSFQQSGQCQSKSALTNSGISSS